MTYDNFSYTNIHIQHPYADKKNNVHEVKSGVFSRVDYEKISFFNKEESQDKGFIPQVKNQFIQPIPSGLLFPAIRYSVPGLLVFERPPTYKLIEYVTLPVDYITEESFDDKSHVFNLALPWQLYVAEYDVNTMLLTQVHMYFMKESFKNSNQIMYMPPLPNFYADGTLCRPFLANMSDIEGYSKDLSGVMASAYDWIWNSGFNHDLMECPMTVYYHKNNNFYDPHHTRTSLTASWQRYLHPKDVLSILDKWEKYTLDNILSVDWPDLSVTRIWDSEVEWFYENDPEYPFSSDHYEGYEDLEHYSENYPVQLYNLKKSFGIMLRSVLGNNYGYSKRISHAARFGLYNKIVQK